MRAIFITIGVGIMLAYPLTEKTFTAMAAETRVRRAERDAHETPTPAQEA